MKKFSNFVKPAFINMHGSHAHQNHYQVKLPVSEEFSSHVIKQDTPEQKDLDDHFSNEISDYASLPTKYKYKNAKQNMENIDKKHHVGSVPDFLKLPSVHNYEPLDIHMSLLNHFKPTWDEIQEHDKAHQIDNGSGKTLGKIQWSFNRFTRDSSNINQHLTNGVDLREVHVAGDDIKHIDHTINLASNQSVPLITYHGTSLNIQKHLQDNKLHIPGYLSSSTSLHIGEFFSGMNSSSDGSRHVLTIHSHAGHGLIPVSRPYHNTYSEYEVLHRRGMTLKHLGSTEYNGTIFHHMEVEK